MIYDDEANVSITEYYVRYNEELYPIHMADPFNDAYYIKIEDEFFRLDPTEYDIISRDKAIDSFPEEFI